MGTSLLLWFLACAACSCCSFLKAARRAAMAALTASDMTWRILWAVRRKDLGAAAGQIGVYELSKTGNVAVLAGQETTLHDSASIARPNRRVLLLLLQRRARDAQRATPRRTGQTGGRSERNAEALQTFSPLVSIEPSIQTHRDCSQFREYITERDASCNEAKQVRAAFMLSRNIPLPPLR